MKRFYFLVTIVIIIILATNGIFYHGIYTGQLSYQKDIIITHTQKCGSEIENTGFNFASEINSILFSENVNEIFEESDEAKNSIYKLSLFYMKYHDFIKNIYLYNNEFEVFSLYQDSRGQFISDYYTSHRQKDLVNREKIISENDKQFYYLPVFKADSVIANIVVNIEFESLFHEKLKNYHINHMLWQWVINDEGEKEVVDHGNIDEVTQEQAEKAIINVIKECKKCD